MDYALIILTALVVSGITLVSGFGLGTVLMPAFAVFFPIPTAIAATAVVHLANNMFKLGLAGKQADWRVATLFSLPAAVAAVAGATALVFFSGLPALVSYEFLDRQHEVTAVKAVIGGLIVGFAMIELSQRFAALAIPPGYLVIGGLLSGFFGGLSGNQGAFRSAFLIKSGLAKEAFVATGVVSAVAVDAVRLAVYGFSYFSASFVALPREIAGIVTAATLAAFAGAYLGSRLLKKITLRAMQVIVALSMIGVGLGLAAGLI